MVARTGRLAPLGAVLDFAAGMFERRARIVLRDSGSTPEGARAATETLACGDRVSVVLSMGGTAVLPVVAATAERLGVPCVTTLLPWQVFAAALPQRPGWANHFAWGLDDIADAFADLWEQVEPRCVVGCLWNDGVQGRALRDRFAATATARGHRLVDLGGYPEGERDFDRHVLAFLDHDVHVVTSAATAADLGEFVTNAARRGLRPRLLTCSRWLTYPYWVARYNLDRVATMVSWTPRHRHISATGRTPAGLARAYQRTGRQWVQPLGLAHALFEVAMHALDRAGNDRHGIAHVLRRTRLWTIAGVLDWPAGPSPGVALIPLAGGQWRLCRDGRHPRLVVVSSARVPAVSCDGELQIDHHGELAPLTAG